MNDYKRTCLSIVRDGEKVLMLLKRKGLGEGYYNFPGGKVEAGEEPCECAIRELMEETCIEGESPEKIGEILYRLDNGETSRMNIYRISRYRGTLCESSEGKPFWTKEIPLDKMWEDDRVWVSMVMAGKKVKCEFYFSSDWKEYRGGECKEVESFPDNENRAYNTDR